MLSTNWYIVIWSNRLIYIIAIIMTLIIIRKEWKKQDLLHTYDHSNKSSISPTKLSIIVPFCLQYLPIITLIIISLSIFLMELGQWPYICFISNRLEISIKAISWICIGFFQLSRLYYIFGDYRLKNHNHIKSYPSKLFIFISIFGLLIIVYFTIIPWIGFSLNNEWSNYADLSVPDILQNGCNTFKMDEIFIFYTAWSIWFIVGNDWFILSLYLVKLCQFYKISDESVHNEKTRAMYFRITYILKKIICLTILYQFAAVSMGIIRAYTKYNGNQYGLIIVHSTIALERIILCIVIILMIEHNDALYQGLINKLFCCCINIKCQCKKHENENDLSPITAVSNNSNNNNDNRNNKDTPTTELDEDGYGEKEEEDESMSSSVPVLSIGSAPKQLNIMIEINQ